MKNSNTTDFPRTIGMDLGVRSTSFCVVKPSGEYSEEGTIKMNKPSMLEFFKVQPCSRIVIEACASSRWVAELAGSCGHEVIVANPRKFYLISKSDRKTDRNDARLLGEFGQVRPDILSPIKLRGLKCQIARSTIAARAHAVRQRTLIVNLMRSQVRNLGESLPSGSAANFHKIAPECIPTNLHAVLNPMIEVLIALTGAISKYDKEIHRLCKEEFPETGALAQITGVGPNTALSFAATIEDPKRFKRSRDVGAYVGLVSKSRNSGDSNPQLRISKRGDKDLRRLLVSAATYIIGPRGQDTDLKRMGERLKARGGQSSRSKARIAVARKLSVLLHRLWVTGEVYDPLRNHNQAAA